MKSEETKKVGDSWYIYKWKRNGRAKFASGFGDNEEVAICGGIYYSKLQLKKSMKRGNCI